MNGNVTFMELNFQERVEEEHHFFYLENILNSGTNKRHTSPTPRYHFFVKVTVYSGFSGVHWFV